MIGIKQTDQRKVKMPGVSCRRLSPENVRQAIEEVRPFAVDVCSGVRTDGSLDRKKLKLFVRNASLKY